MRRLALGAMAMVAAVLLAACDDASGRDDGGKRRQKKRPIGRGEDMHDIGRSKLAKRGQVEALIRDGPDESQAFEPSRSARKGRIDRDQLNVISVRAQMIGEHLGLHGLAAQNAQTWRDHGNSWTRHSIASH